MLASVRSFFVIAGIILTRLVHNGLDIFSRLKVLQVIGCDVRLRCRLKIVIFTYDNLNRLELGRRAEIGLHFEAVSDLLTLLVVAILKCLQDFLHLNGYG